MILTGGLDAFNQPVAGTERFIAFFNGWQQVGPLNPPVFGHAAVQVKGQPSCGATCDNSVYVIGGANAQFAQVGAIQKFQPSANSWTSAGTMAGPNRAFHCASLFDRDIKSGDNIFWSGGRGATSWNLWSPAFGFQVGETAGARIHAACGPIAPSRLLTSGGLTDTSVSMGLSEEFALSM
jgi:hypothetical protein